MTYINYQILIDYLYPKKLNIYSNIPIMQIEYVVNIFKSLALFYKNDNEIDYLPPKDYI
jgi:hypothetical protein